MGAGKGGETMPPRVGGFNPVGVGFFNAFPMRNMLVKEICVTLTALGNLIWDCLVPTWPKAGSSERA